MTPRASIQEGKVRKALNVPGHSGMVRTNFHCKTGQNNLSSRATTHPPHKQDKIGDPISKRINQHHEPRMLQMLSSTKCVIENECKTFLNKHKNRSRFNILATHILMRVFRPSECPSKPEIRTFHFFGGQTHEASESKRNIPKSESV